MTVDKLFEEATLSWRDNEGIGTALVPAPLNDKVLVYQVLSRIYTRSPTNTTLIIVEQLKDRGDIIEFLTHQDNEENDAEFKKLIDNKLIRVYTKSFMSKYFWNDIAKLCILYRPEDYDATVDTYFKSCKFKLVILNKLLDNNKNKYNLFKLCPLLPCFKETEINELRVSSPVEEMWEGITIPEDSESWKLYEYYCKYIETSLNIFGSFNIMQEARVGNPTLNISAASVCDNIAKENGWHEHLDMSYEFNQKIDELYNPNNLRARATQTYEIIRNRSNLIADYDAKLEKILEIVKQCKDDKILIINKRGEFANKVTDYLNSNSEVDICGNYHNKVDDIPAIDIDGNPIYFKSGKEKGKRKSMSVRSQMTLNETKFNLGRINCLSMGNAPDKSLSVEFDTIIITSPLCEDIKSYLYRLSNIRVKGEKIKLFSIFCKHTIEQQKLFNKPVSDTHEIVNKNEIMAEETNKIDFILAD